MMNDKRGLIAHWTDLIVTVFLGLFLFFFLNGILQEDIHAKEQQSLTSLQSVQGEEIMQNYLRTTVEGITITELVRRSQQDEAAFLQLKTATQQIIAASNNPLFQGISLEDPETQFWKEIFFNAHSSTLTTLYHSSTLPVADGKSIIIHLYKER